MESASRIASAFAELYAACGLPPPAVRLERAEADYRRSAKAISALEGPGAFRMAVCVGLVLCCALCMATGLLSIIKQAMGEGHLPMPFALALAAAGCAMFFCISWIDGCYGAGARIRRILSEADLNGMAQTPWQMEVFLGSALQAAGGAASPGFPGGVPSVLEASFRLGRRAVVPPAPDPRRNALVGRAPGAPAGVLPGVLRISADVAALVEEAILLDGFVLALAPIPGNPDREASTVVPPLPGTVSVAWGLAGIPQAEPEDMPGLAWSTPSGFLKRVMGQPPGRAEAVLRALDLDAVVRTLRVPPFQADEAGRLHRFGALLSMVRVEDAVAGPDGKPLVHWVTVPPHVLTAREGVAWSFGLPGAAYAPTSES